MRLFHRLQFYLLFAVILTHFSANAQVNDNRRLSGFAEHKKFQKKFDEVREKSVGDYLQEKEQDEKERTVAEEKYRKKKKLVYNMEEGPEYQEYLAEVRHRQKKYQAAMEEYRKEKSVDRAKIEKRHLSEEEELGLQEQADRYDYSKRCIYGGYSKLCKKLAGPGGGSGSSSGGRFGGSGSSSGGGNFPPPPPPTFDDFGDDYIPPPAFSEDGELLPPPPPMLNDDFGDSPLPPPPPLPPLPGDGDF